MYDFVFYFQLSIQFAILVERHITKAVRALRYSLKRLANASEAPR